MALIAKDVVRAHLVGCLTENSGGLTLALERTTHNLSFVLHSGHLQQWHRRQTKTFFPQAAQAPAER